MCKADSVGQVSADGTIAFGTAYSKSEVSYYKGEIDILNEELKKKKMERKGRRDNYADKLPSLQQEPLDLFLKSYADAVEKLCSEQGLGRKYGAPRRDAQERCRTMMARTATALHSIGEYT